MKSSVRLQHVIIRACMHFLFFLAGFMIKCLNRAGWYQWGALLMEVAIITTPTRLFEAAIELFPSISTFPAEALLYGILQLQKKINRRRDFLHWWTKWIFLVQNFKVRESLKIFKKYHEINTLKPQNFKVFFIKFFRTLKFKNFKYMYKIFHEVFFYSI